jgi:hypothetical protein
MAETRPVRCAVRRFFPGAQVCLHRDEDSMRLGVGDGGVTMSFRTGISAGRLKRFAEASSLLLALVGAWILAAWIFHLSAWERIASGWTEVTVAPAVVFAAAGLAVWIVVTVLLWFSAGALHRAQQKIAHRERLYAVLSQCNQSIVHINERGPLFSRICEIAVELGKFRMAG